MPHVVVLYTPDLEAPAAQLGCGVDRLCRSLADTLLTIRDEQDHPVFPVGGVRVLAYPATHFAVADGSGEHGFVYVQLRMGRGRSDAVKQRTGQALADAARAHFEPLFAQRHFGLTVQVDEGTEAFDARVGNLHPLFRRP